MKKKMIPLVCSIIMFAVIVALCFVELKTKETMPFAPSARLIATLRPVMLYSTYAVFILATIHLWADIGLKSEQTRLISRIIGIVLGLVCLGTLIGYCGFGNDVAFKIYVCFKAVPLLYTLPPMFLYFGFLKPEA